MLKILQLKTDRDVYIITTSPLEQYSHSKTKIKERGEETNPLGENENAIVVFDDFLGSKNSKYIDQFFMTGRRTKLYIYYLSQIKFEFPKRTIRNKSNKMVLFSQTLKDFENMYRDVGGYGMR